MTAKPHRIHRRLTEQEQRDGAAIREEVQRTRPKRTDTDRAKAAQLRAISAAFCELRSLREQRGLSLADVAQRCGIDRSNLHKLETAEFPNPTFETLYRYARALDMEVSIELSPRHAA